MNIIKMSIVQQMLQQLDTILEKYDKKDVLTPQEQEMKKELEERYQELVKELDGN